MIKTRKTFLGCNNKLCRSAWYACEAIKNEISECLNSIIVEARRNPLITTLEHIRVYIMDRIVHMFWLIVHSQGLVFEAKFNYESFTLDLETVINYIHNIYNGYASEYFSKDRFIKCYQTNIIHINRNNLWEQNPFPPKAKRIPRIPTTKRRRHASKNKIKFSTTIVNVSKIIRYCNFF
uniref:Uncharacterized protein n=1 Tax=Lactuca sativa TaxID=4236 RepID=A0A9R1UJ15_LACSA|nr:hypothetical protein LSAT_V11C900489480 [Lactuca sativa]